MAEELSAVDGLLREVSLGLSSVPENAVVPLEKLKALQPSLTPVQNERYQHYQASSLGYRGKHEERVRLVQAFLPQVMAPDKRVKFFYELIDGNTALGRYEAALKAMNESVLLLPTIEGTDDKIVALQGAVTLLQSLRAYDEALDFAQRIYALRANEPGSNAACIGLANQVEINFLRGNGQGLHALVPQAILACDANKNPIITLIVKTLAVIEVIDSGKYAAGLATSLPLLNEYAVMSESSDYLTQLEDAVARAYLKTGNTERAEHYGLRAYQGAQAGKALTLQEKTNATMAAIKRTQGQLVQAMGYCDVNLALKQRVLDVQMQKNLAYQRVKFDTQDKANQMTLLAQKNNSLRMEKKLQEREIQNLVLGLTLGLVMLTIVGAWLFRTLRQRNIFRSSAQVDALTQVSSRGHFTACARQAFKGSGSRVSLVLFDMDLFKHVNDRFGHATGDWVLKTVCDTVRAQLRKTDHLGRIGGEEFAICLPQFSEEEVIALAERCRAAIAAIDTRPSGFEFQITASFGIATSDQDGPVNFDEALAAADKALYLSKNEGRNRVTVYQHPGA